MKGNTKLCAAALLLLLGACEDAGQTCTLIGCDSGFSWTLDSPVGFEVLSDARVRICRNDRCVEGAAVRQDREPGIATVITLMNGAGDRVDFTVLRSEPVELDVQWYLRADEARDGDVYSLELKDAAGVVVLDEEHTVAKYEASYPNGRRCDREPCRTAFVDDRRDAGA